MPDPVYISTPIYYVNDRPHIGHVYTTTVCDVYARAMRLAGRDVFFLTGTDEHGVKVEKSATERGISPQALADENAAFFRNALETFGLTSDDFIRTTDEHHERQVQAFVRKLLDTGSVYLGEFEGWYDEGQEEYLTETKAKELDYKSPVNQKPLVRAREKNYYFRLSAFQERIETLYADHPEYVRPEARRNEMLGRIREGLQDVPMSRTNFTWGIPMPDDPEHVIYVWIDALMNYITAIGLGEPDSDLAASRTKYWPAVYHVVGKEILWFHSVIWPAILMALDLPQAGCIYAHSFWIREGRKMSKSLGNFVDLEVIQQYVDAYGLDMWRYYMIAQGPLGATDADFSSQQFHDVYHTDLVNTYGNCTSRVTAMINKYFDGVLPENSTPIDGYDWPETCAQAVRDADQALERLELADVARIAMDVIRKVDAFINETEPFRIAKDDTRRAELGSILYQCLEALRIASILLWPLMPQRTSDFWTAINEPLDPASGGRASRIDWGGLAAGTAVQKVALFPRVDGPLEQGGKPTG